MGIVSQSANNQIDRIQQIYGSTISYHVKFTEYQNSKWKLRLYFSDVTKESLKSNVNTFIIFVNSKLFSKYRQELNLLTMTRSTS